MAHWVFRKGFPKAILIRHTASVVRVGIDGRRRGSYSVSTGHHCLCLARVIMPLAMGGYRKEWAHNDYSDGRYRCCNSSGRVVEATSINTTVKKVSVYTLHHTSSLASIWIHGPRGSLACNFREPLQCEGNRPPTDPTAAKPCVREHTPFPHFRVNASFPEKRFDVCRHVGFWHCSR